MFKNKKNKQLPATPEKEKPTKFFGRRKVTFENHSDTEQPSPVDLLYSASAIASRLSLPVLTHTFQHSTSDASTLAAIFVFANHHPLWKNNPPKLFVNTNLALLNNPENRDKEFPVFERSGTSRGAHTRFSFLGWARLAEVQFLKPESPELTEMLAMKWGSQKMQGPVWDQSLRKSWAIVSLDMRAGMLRDPMRD